MALQIIKGPSTNRTLFTPAIGELIYTTDTKLVYVGDGTTPGGNLVGSVAPGGGGAVDVVGETPAGLINGSNATYTTVFYFDPSSVEVFINGIRQKRVTHFNTSGLVTIILSDSPQTGDILQVNYERV